MKRSISLFCALIVAATVISCGETTSQPVVTDKGDIVTTEAETSIYDSLPQADLGGYEFRVLNNTSNFATTIFDIEEQSGDILEDAVYIRNRYVENRLNCVISVQDESYDVVNSMVSKGVQSGEDFADIYFNECYFQTGHSLNGFLTDTAVLSDVDITQPWWNSEAIESIRIGSPVYILFGDLHLMYGECYQPVYLNNGLIKNYGLDKPYKLVTDGVWTLDRMSEYMSVVTTDLDGDGKMTAQDQFGLGVFSHNVLALLIGASATIVDRNSDNLPYWNGITEDFINRYTKVVETIFSDPDRITNDSTKGANSLPLALHSMFHDGRCLFFIEPLGSLKKHRDADFEVGVVPTPKYDEAQSEYCSYLFHGAAGLALPATSTHYAEVGLILENLAAYSHKDLISAYYDATLDFKYVNDKESVKMLDIIFSNGRLDLGRVYGWGGYSEQVGGQLAKGNTDVVSLAAKLEKKIVSDIEKTLELYQG